MKVEVIEFYQDKQPKKSCTMSGTMHVYIPDFDLDLRGIVVLKGSKGYMFYLPSRFAIDETGKKIMYPILSFADTRKHKQLIKDLRIVGIKFIEDRRKESV
jgi:DNA-binding cell septation regulator SpoVG